MNFFYAVTLALSDIKREEIKKLSVINGIIWAVVWIVLGFILWKPLTGFTVFMISLLPFKFLQHAGANFIVIILWLQAVLITLGIFFSLFNQILSKKFLSVFISLIVSVFWFAVFFYYYDSILMYLEKLIRIFPFETVEDAVSAVLSVFILYSFYIASVYLGFLLFGASKIEKLKNEDYPDIDTDKNFSYFKLIFIIFRDLLFFFIAFIVLYPLLFVPFLNLFIIIFLWAFMIKEALIQTVQMIFGEMDINKKRVWIFAFASVIFNFVPIINLFAPAFGILLIYRYLFEKRSDIIKKA